MKYSCQMALEAELQHSREGKGRGLEIHSRFPAMPNFFSRFCFMRVLGFHFVLLLHKELINFNYDCASKKLNFKKMAMEDYYYAIQRAMRVVNGTGSREIIK